MCDVWLYVCSKSAKRLTNNNWTIFLSYLGYSLEFESTNPDSLAYGKDILFYSVRVILSKVLKYLYQQTTSWGFIDISISSKILDSNTVSVLSYAKSEYVEKVMFVSNLNLI